MDFVLSGNVFLWEGYRAKIIDFGLSAVRDLAATQVTGLVATAAWSAPEALRGEPVRQSADVYSFGEASDRPSFDERVDLLTAALWCGELRQGGCHIFMEPMLNPYGYSPAMTSQLFRTLFLLAAFERYQKNIIPINYTDQ